MPNLVYRLTAIALGLLVLAVVTIGMASILWWAWNSVIPYTFGLPYIDGTQAFALLLILGIASAVLRSR